MKIRFDIKIDPQLKKVISQNACERNMYMSDLIAEIISNYFNIPLNGDYTVNESEFKKYELKRIDDKIKSLEARKKEIIGGV